MLRYPSTQEEKPYKSKKIALAKEVNNQERQLKQKTGFLHSHLGSQAAKEKRFTLGIGDFMCIDLGWELSLLHAINYETAMIEYGSFTTSVGYFIMGMIIGIPLQMMLLFLGRYTRRGYFRFWDICPMFKGMIFAVSLFSLCLEMLNLSYSAFALTFASKTLRGKLPWPDCKFVGATPACRPMYTSFPKYTKECCFFRPKGNCTFKLTNIVFFSTHEYLRMVVFTFQLKPYHMFAQGFGYISTPWIYAVAFNWFLIFMCLAMGFKQFQSIVLSISAIIGIVFFIPTLLGTIIVGSQYGSPAELSESFEKFVSPGFWYLIFVHAIHRLSPGNFIYLGSVAPDALKPTTIVFITFGVKFIFHLLIASWRSVGMQLIGEHYNIKDHACLPIDGIGTFFSVVPDLLSRLPLPQLILVTYFIGLWYLGWSTTLYTVNAFVESLIEHLPIIKQWRMFFCACIIFLCFLLNMVFITSIHLQPAEIFSNVFIPYGTYLMFFCFFITMFTYSLRRIAGDYYFTYGVMLHGYWINTLKYSGFYMFVIMIVRHITVLSGTFEPNYTGINNKVLHIFFYSLNSIMTIAIVFVVVLTYLRFKNLGDASESTAPSRYWGPPTEELKQLRINFKPHREFHYVSYKPCNHTCLLNSEKLIVHLKEH